MQKAQKNSQKKPLKDIVINKLIQKDNTFSTRYFNQNNFVSINTKLYFTS